jgi:tRNA U34 5-methylaminomethyl-2-thiouridine-forming methyltransferase MnmC
MELEHLRTNAAEPYRDPSGRASRSTILQERQRRQRDQLAAGVVEPTGQWRRRWGLESTARNPQ